MEHGLWIRGGSVKLVARLAGRVLACVAVATLAVVVPVHAQDAGAPAQLIVTVVPPNDHAPRPTGDVIVSVNGQPLLTVPLVAGLQPLTALTPLAQGTLAALGQQVTIGYSGDNNYEASDGVVVTVPSSTELVTITAQPRDSAAPVIDIVSPGDGVRYERGEPVVAIYSCTDPEDRSPVTRCEGPVPTGAAIDTSTNGTFSFTVQASDAVGNATPKAVTYTVGTAAAPEPSTAGGTPPAAPPPPPAAPRAPADAVSALPPVVTAALAAAAAAVDDVAALSEKKAPAKSKSAGASAAAPAPATEPANETPTARAQLTAYDPRSEPEKTFGILAAGLTLLTLAVGGGGIARGGGVAKPGAGAGAAGRTAPKGGTSRPGFSGLSSYQGLEIRHLSAGFGAVAVGDRSSTWRWPGTQRIDYLAAALPLAIARRSPLLGRVFADSAYLRAIFGAASLLFRTAATPPRTQIGAVGEHSPEQGRAAGDGERERGREVVDPLRPRPPPRR